MTNFNFIIGNPGSGKTFHLQELLAQTEERVIIFSPYEGDYSKIENLQIYDENFNEMDFIEKLEEEKNQKIKLNYNIDEALKFIKKLDTYCRDETLHIVFEDGSDSFTSDNFMMLENLRAKNFCFYIVKQSALLLPPYYPKLSNKILTISKDVTRSDEECKFLELTDIEIKKIDSLKRFSFFIKDYQFIKDHQFKEGDDQSVFGVFFVMLMAGLLISFCAVGALALFGVTTLPLREPVIIILTICLFWHSARMVGIIE